MPRFVRGIVSISLLLRGVHPMNAHSTERGQVLILIAIGIVGIIGLVALAVDGGNAFADRRAAQNAADSAAYAATLAYVNDQSTYDAVFHATLQNGYPNDGQRSLVNLTIDDIAHGCVDARGNPVPGALITVEVTSFLETWLARVVGVTQITNQVSATTRGCKKRIDPIFDGNALVSLNTSACRAFEVSGNATVTVNSDSGTGIFVNSNCSSLAPAQQAYFQNRATLVVPALSVVGGAYLNEPNRLVLTASSGVFAGAQPLNTQVVYPDVRCTGSATLEGTTLQPGNYPGGNSAWRNQTFPPQGVTELAPGAYCITGGVSFNSDISGTGVTLFVEEGSLSMNGNAQIMLYAPVDGPWARLLIFLPPENRATVAINGNAASELVGTILAPSSNIRINGTGSPAGLDTQIIGDTITISGDSDMKINYNDAQNYDIEIPPTVELRE
jgi:hypothetical protein